jgi:hypothetical protein
LPVPRRRRGWIYPSDFEEMGSSPCRLCSEPKTAWKSTRSSPWTASTAFTQIASVHRRATNTGEPLGDRGSVPASLITLRPHSRALRPDGAEVDDRPEQGSQSRSRDGVSDQSRTCDEDPNSPRPSPSRTPTSGDIPGGSRGGRFGGKEPLEQCPVCGGFIGGGGGPTVLESRLSS